MTDVVASASGRVVAQEQAALDLDNGRGGCWTTGGGRRGVDLLAADDAGRAYGRVTSGASFGASPLVALDVAAGEAGEPVWAGQPGGDTSEAAGGPVLLPGAVTRGGAAVLVGEDDQALRRAGVGLLVAPGGG